MQSQGLWKETLVNVICCLQILNELTVEMDLDLCWNQKTDRDSTNGESSRGLEGAYSYSI